MTHTPDPDLATLFDRARELQPIEPVTVKDSTGNAIVVLPVPKSHVIADLTAQFEQQRDFPLRKRGRLIVETMDSFVVHTQRHRNDATTIYVTPSPGRLSVITAIYNDNQGTHGPAGHRDFSAAWPIQHHETYAGWVKACSGRLKHEEFAQLIHQFGFGLVPVPDWNFVPDAEIEQLANQLGLTITPFDLAWAIQTATSPMAPPLNPSADSETTTLSDDGGADKPLMTTFLLADANVVINTHPNLSREQQADHLRMAMLRRMLAGIKFSSPHRIHEISRHIAINADKGIESQYNPKTGSQRLTCGDIVKDNLPEWFLVYSPIFKGTPAILLPFQLNYHTQNKSLTIGIRFPNQDQLEHGQLETLTGLLAERLSGDGDDIPMIFGRSDVSV